jgi:DNA-binding MarR family transcriptional regulator
LPKALRFLNELRTQSPEMTVNEAAILLLIARNPSLSQGDVRAETGLSASAVSRNVGNLCTRELVIARESPMDRRYDWLALTSVGEAFVRRLTGVL